MPRTRFRRPVPRAVSLCALAALLLGAATPGARAQGTEFFPEEQIPRFNLPRLAKPPVCDGKIEPDEWRGALRIMGMSHAHSNTLIDRPHAFYVGWDAQHLYIAGRAHVLPGHVLGKSRREKYTTGVVFDDAFEFGVGLFGRNQLPGEAESFFKFVLNYLGCGEYMKMYPSIGQYLYNWRPEMQIGNGLRGSPQDPDGYYWETELALDLADLQMPVPNQAGDPVRILLAHDGKNPGWVWTHVPSASGYLVHTGFPTGTLTDGQPYVQIEQLDGLAQETLAFKSVVYNPGAQPVRVRARLQVVNHGQVAKEPVTKVGVEKDVVLEIPAGGQVRFDVEQAFPGFDYRNEGHPKYNQMQGAFDLRFTLADQPEAAPVLTQHLEFRADPERKWWSYTAKPELFRMETLYNPVRSTIWISADTLDTNLTTPGTPAAATYRVRQGERNVCEGKITRLVNAMYVDLVQMPTLAAGEYEVAVELVDAAGKVLASRQAKIAKKDEAKEFADWWGNTIGNPEQLLKPFAPLKAGKGKLSRTAVTCTRRVYEFDSLGLPLQIEANGGPVLTAPARLVLTVAGREHVVPVKPALKLTGEKPWKVTFEGEPAEVAGVRFSSRGTLEQDGLVSIELTYAPAGAPVAVQELAIEWPVGEREGNSIACMGVGGNYSARFIGRVPDGDGLVWSTLKHIGQAGSGMTVGNFYQNLWVGDIDRGLLWWGNSDEGWVPNERVAAHDIVRQAAPGGTATVVRNHLVATYPGEVPFRLEKARTVRFSYNASPFKKLTPGWRLNQRSAANGFSGGKYKVNWDTGQDYFSILSPPFKDRARWPEYYAHCQDAAEALAKTRGLYDPGARLLPYTCNQIALRGYMEKTVEPGLYGYFGPEWNTNDSGEPLNPTYADYMFWLQQKQVREGGCRAFYYDISMCGRISKAISSGQGYFLDDGRIQPTGTDAQLRYWYQRAYAMMQENGLWPTGISGHSTNTIPLVALPFCDAQLDSEFPMADPIAVYPSERMIALSCPHTFGCNINHLGFMNPDWAGMHDAGMGGGHGSVFDRTEWRHWGIARDDVQFIPYWRNGGVVRRIGDGLIASLWKRPGSAIVGILNYGLDPAGFEKTRPGELVLDLAALGVPADARGERLRVRELGPGQRYGEKFVGPFAWYQALPGTPNQYNPKEIMKYRPPCEPRLDPETGALTGFDVFYHDQRYIVITWDEKPVDAALLEAVFPEVARTAVRDWGFDQAKPVEGTELAACARVDEGGFQVLAWKRPGSVLLKLTNPGAQNAVGQLMLDLAKLGVQVAPEEVWARFTAVVPLDGTPVDNVYWPGIEKETHRWQRGTLCFDGNSGKVVVLLKPGETRVVAIDKY